MVAIETFDRGRRLVRGQVFQPSPRYPRCLRDDPRMPRQASPVPAGSRTQAFLAFQATLRLQMNFCTQHSVATNCMLRSRSVIASIGRFSYFLYYLFSFPPYYEDAILILVLSFVWDPLEYSFEELLRMRGVNHGTSARAAWRLGNIYRWK